jgi:hypothetical protein
MSPLKQQLPRDGDQAGERALRLAGDDLLNRRCQGEVNG